MFRNQLILLWGELRRRHDGNPIAHARVYRSGCIWVIGVTLYQIVRDEWLLGPSSPSTPTTSQNGWSWHPHQYSRSYVHSPYISARDYIYSRSDYIYSWSDYIYSRSDYIYSRSDYIYLRSPCYKLTHVSYHIRIRMWSIKTPQSYSTLWVDQNSPLKLCH